MWVYKLFIHFYWLCLKISLQSEHYFYVGFCVAVTPKVAP